MFPIRCHLMVLCVLLTMILSGCGLFGRSTSSVTTRVDPATVSLTDSFTEKTTGDTRRTAVKVEPGCGGVATTAPAAVVITQAQPPVTVEVEGRRVTAPAGSSVAIETNDHRIPAETSHARTANAAGATLRTNGEQGSFSGDAPKVGLESVANVGIGGGSSKGGGGTASGGDMGAAWSALVASAVATGARWGWLIGLALIVGSIGMIVVSHIMGTKTDWPLVAILAGGGLAVIVVSVVAERYPWMFLLLFIGAIAAAVWYEFVWKKKEAAETKPQITAGQSPASPGTA